MIDVDRIDADLIDTDSAARLIATYDGFGLRRAGTSGDRLAAQWLLGHLQRAGVEAATRDIPMAVRNVQSAYLEGQDASGVGWRIDGLPLFDAPDTDGVLHGVLGTDIALIEMEPGAASIKGQPLEAQRRSSTARAIIIATRGAGGSLAPINAQYYDAPFGPPILQVAGAAFAALSARAQRGDSARIIISTESTPGASTNVEACGSLTLPDIVLTTPRTSWGESTAERVGGIVAWLAAFRYAAGARRQSRSLPTMRGFATCGHELGHIGLNDVFAQHHALLTQARLWLHLGANLGCASDTRLTVRASDPQWALAMRDDLVTEGYDSTAIVIEPIERAQGEGRDLLLQGARVLSLIGANAHFHAPSDRWPGNVDARAVAVIARAVCRWSQRVEF